MLSDQLKEETSAVHQQLEKRLAGLIRGIRDTRDYERILRLFFGYINGLEQRIDKVIDHDRLEDYDLRRKSALILDDLTMFSTEPPYSTPVHVDLPEIADHFQAMGALYVLENVTLSGKISIKLVKDQLGLKSRKGLSFFRGYAEDTWQKWEAYKRSLNVLPRNSPEAKKVTLAVLETFDKFIGWIADYEKQDVPQ